MACAYSLLLHQGAPTLRYAELLKLLQPCEERVWTIDLVLLLHAFGLRGVRMQSTLPGVDPSHGHMRFYDHFDRDTKRVAKVFQEAQRRGIDVQQRSAAKMANGKRSRSTRGHCRAKS